MSGGTYNYDQYRIRNICEVIESYIERQGKSLEDNFGNQEEFYETYEPEVLKRLSDAVECLKKAYVYAHRVDWFLAGDDGNDSFVKRLDEELSNLKSK